MKLNSQQLKVTKRKKKKKAELRNYSGTTEMYLENCRVLWPTMLHAAKCKWPTVETRVLKIVQSPHLLLTIKIYVSDNNKFSRIVLVAYNFNYG